MNMFTEDRARRTSKPLAVAVCGLGWWGRTIVALLQTGGKLRVVLGVDPVAPMDGITHEKSFEAALRHPEVEAVVLCTPHTMHSAQIIQAAQAGKHVFCEKPLSLSRAEVLRAVEAINAGKRVLAVGHEKRFEPPVQEAMRLLPQASWGSHCRSRQISARTSSSRSRRTTGASRARKRPRVR